MAVTEPACTTHDSLSYHNSPTHWWPSFWKVFSEPDSNKKLSNTATTGLCIHHKKLGGSTTDSEQVL